MENANWLGTGTVRKKRLVALVIVGALIAAPDIAAVAAYAGGASPASTPTGRAITAVLGAGLFNKLKGGFHPKDPVNRETLALALQRGLVRMTSVSVGSSVAASSTGELASLQFSISGAPHHAQGVLLTFHGQLDHDNALSAGCFPAFEITKNGDPSVVASRTQEEYGGGGGTGLELPISMEFLLVQKTTSTVTYHLKMVNPCTATLFIDGGDFDAQNVVLAGAGTAIKPAGGTNVGVIPRHDRRSAQP